MGGVSCTACSNSCNNNNNNGQDGTVDIISEKTLQDGFPMNYPMYVMKISDALQLTEIVSHQELLRTGKIVPFKSGMEAAFISHQWVGLQFPDARFQQFQVLQSSIRKLVSGETKLRVCPTTVLEFGRFEPITTVQQLINLKENGYIWYDYFGVPQLQARGKQADAADTQSAVDSIPAYIEACSCFLVLAPWCEHNDTNEVCSKFSWESRGWCRTEQAIYSLTTLHDVDYQRAFFIFHDGFIQESIPMQWLFTLPHEGNFTVEADRIVVSRLMHMAIVKRKAFLKSKHRKFEFRFLQAIGHHIVLELFQPFTSLENWLSRYGFNDIEDACQPEGWSPACFAALEGNTAAIQALAAAGASVNCATLNSVAQVMGPSGMTPLMIAACYIPDVNNNRQACGCLVELDADIHARSHKGQTVLHIASMYPGGLKTAEMLMNRGIDVNCTDSTGETPLHQSTLRNCTTCCSRLETSKLLLSRGARWDQVGGDLGVTPWAWVAPTGRKEDVRLFLDARADPNSTLPMEDDRRSKYWNETLSKRPQDNILFQICPHLAGATPLMLGSWIGNWETLQVLLQARADPTSVSCSGRTARDYIEDTNGKGKIVQVLQQANDAAQLSFILSVSSENKEFLRTPARNS